MTLSLNAITEAQNPTDGATCLGRGSALAQRHLNNTSGRESLPLVRVSAGGLLHRSRATSQALRFNSARLGSLFINSPHHRTGKFADVAHRHLKSLSCSASSSAERKARKAFHDHGEVTQVLGQIIRGEND